MRINHYSSNNHNISLQLQNYSMERSIIRRNWNKTLITSKKTPFKRVYTSNNSKFVSDHSDYIRYLKQRNINIRYKK